MQYLTMGYLRFLKKAELNVLWRITMLTLQKYGCNFMKHTVYIKWFFINNNPIRPDFLFGAFFYFMFFFLLFVYVCKNIYF